MTGVDTSDNLSAAAVVRVKVALLTLLNGVLLLGVQETRPCRLLVGQPDRDDSLDGVARSTLKAVVGSDTGYMEQLYTFSFGRSDRRDIVVSYLALVSGAPEFTAPFHWQPASAARDCLLGTDQTVLDYSLVRLRAKIGYTTIAFHLMAESFTLSDLQHTYETILDRPVDPRNFRRRIISSGLVQAENRKRREGSHRPAALYRFAGNHDPGSYLTPPDPGMERNTETEMTSDFT